MFSNHEKTKQSPLVFLRFVLNFNIFLTVGYTFYHAI